MTSDEYSEKLRQQIYKAAGSKVEFLGIQDEIRTAISRNSGPTSRMVTTAIGWTSEGSAFLFPGGYVDSTGWHAFETWLRQSRGGDSCKRERSLDPS